MAGSRAVAVVPTLVVVFCAALELTWIDLLVPVLGVVDANGTVGDGDETPAVTVERGSGGGIGEEAAEMDETVGDEDSDRGAAATGGDEAI